MGKKFSDSWMEDLAFKDWLRPVVGNSQQAYCSVCKKKKPVSVNLMGANALRSHMQSFRHKNGMHARREQLPLPLSTFCAVTPPPPPAPQTSANVTVTVTASATTSGRWCDHSAVHVIAISWGQRWTLPLFSAFQAACGCVSTLNAQHILHWPVKVLPEPFTAVAWASHRGERLLHKQRGGNM